MKLIQETDYAFRIVLALYANGTMLSAGQISEMMHITEGFTKKILNKLVKSKLIQSRRGIEGGYVPARTPEQVTLLDIVRSIEGELNINRCLQEDTECTRLTDKQTCVIHCELGRINRILTYELSRTDFKLLLQKTQ